VLLVRVSLIAAVAENGVIGRENDLPWRLKNDLRFFMRMTRGRTVITGRKNLEAMGGALRDRRNIVLSRDPDWELRWRAAQKSQAIARSFSVGSLSVGEPSAGPVGAPATVSDVFEVQATLEAALASVSASSTAGDEVFVIGGAAIYALALPWAQTFYRTRVLAQVDGETRFPDFDISEWVTEELFRHPADKRNEHAFVIERLSRRAPPPGHLFAPLASVDHRATLSERQPGKSRVPSYPPSRRAEASLETLRKIFTVPESEQSTLNRLDREISENLLGFLGSRVVAGDIAPANLEQDFLETRIPENPMFVTEQVDFLLSKVVAQSVRTSAPSFVGHMTSALPYFMFPLAKIMTTLNQNVVKIETSKAFTPLERQVVGMLHRLVYQGSDEFYAQWTQSFTHSLGVFCSGGTIANVTALWAARNRRFRPADGFAGIAEEGLPRALRHAGLDDVVVFVSERGHYSLSKSADLLGLGTRNLRRIPVTSAHTIDLALLRRELEVLKAQRIGVLALVGIAGATETGTIDPLDALADLAEEHGAHFHVDAAWGGPTLFSRTHRSLLKGIERADSVTLDAHKQLYVPVGAGMVVFKDVHALSAVEHHANYVIRRGSRDIGKHTLEGTRPGMAMLVHSALRIIGQRGYELLIDLGLQRAVEFAQLIREAPDFELVTPPVLNLLTYRYVPLAARRVFEQGSDEERRNTNELLSTLTESIQRVQRAGGRSFVSRTRLQAAAHRGQELTVFRVVLANPLTTTSILAEILAEQREHAERIWREDGYQVGASAPRSR
jgi:glutamate decarboxylase